MAFLWRRALPLALTVASALSLPSFPQTRCEKDIDLLDLKNGTFAKFKIPCLDWTCNDKDGRNIQSLIFELEVFSSPETCGSTNVTVNGESLSRPSTDSTVWREGTISGPRDDWNITAQWAFQCLSSTRVPDRTRSRSIAQALFFVIREVNGHALQGSQGFLASIGQQPTPEILRVGSLGNLHPNNDPSTRAEWAQPAPHLRLFPNKPLATKPSPSTIDELINQVAGMKEDVTVLQEAIKEKEKLLRILTGEHSPQEHVPIKHCKNLSCAFNTMVDRAHNILKTVKVPVKSEWAQHRSHFRCNKHHHQHQGSVCKSSDDRCSHVRPPLPPNLPSTHGSSDSHHQTTPTDDLGPSRPTSPSRSHYHLPGSEEVPLGHTSSSYFPDPKWAFHLSHSGFHPALIFVPILLALLIPVFLCLCLRRRCCCARSRAERRWLRESRQAARSVRRAQRREALRKWWKQTCCNPWNDAQGRRITDYEEKRTLVRGQEGVLEDAMQTEIRSLTNAARLVSSLVSSDGSASNTSRGPGTPVDDETPFSPPRGLHRSGSFPPDYRSEASEPPPIYDDVEEGAVEEFVADGFQYTPTGSCETPESSVVPTSEISERLEDEEWQKD